MIPSEEIKRIYDPKGSKTTVTAHKRLDSIVKYLDEALPQKAQLASQILGPLLSTGTLSPDEAVRVANDAADRIMVQ